jgi:PAS domain S-box-containing protein
MNGKENNIIQELNHIVDQILSGKKKLDLDVIDVDGIEEEGVKLLASNIIHLGEQYRDCYRFMVDLSCGRLYTEPPRMNAFANPFKQLHSELRHLTWQIQEIANGDYDQFVSFSGDFSDAINKMIIALRERQVLSERIRENENLFHSIFSTSPDGIVLCDLDHHIINASNAAYCMFHLTDEINGKNLFDELIHPEDMPKFKWFIDSLMTGGRLTVFTELRVVLQNGNSFWSEQNASLLLDSNSVPKGYIIIIRDISERKIAEAQLLKYTDELDESNRTKDKLFSIIAHDLRSPFNALLGSSNILVQEIDRLDIDIDRIRKFSKIMNESATRAFNLLNNLLEWSRLQSDRIVIKPEQLNLSDVIIENVQISDTVAMEKNIRLEYLTPGYYPLVSDRAIINAILRNLISNAIKYTPNFGYIKVSLVIKGNMYQVSVQDNGVGIPTERIDKLFRLDTIQTTPGTANEKGTGLGLVLCKDFVNIIGGDIWVESPYGQGATFSFTLKNLS